MFRLFRPVNYPFTISGTSIEFLFEYRRLNRRSRLDIWDYIKNTRAEVHDLENRLHKAKANVEQIQRLMSTWQDVPLYKRSEGKSTLLYLDDKEQRLNNRYKEIDETGKKIHGLLKENGELLKVENYDTDAWKNYVDYVDRMVLEGFRKTIHCNLVFFLRETDPAQSPDPLFESQLQLQVNIPCPLRIIEDICFQ